ncbi:MAG: acireductone dioxygenase [Candidatus Melainabacteria bacterium]
MSMLTIPDRGETITDESAVRDFLNARGIVFERWVANRPLPDDASQEDILAAYADCLQPYMAANGYQTADVINVSGDTPNLQALRDQFLKEHTHTEDEVRYFVAGRGFFWFNLERADTPVFCVECTAGHLLSVPAHVKHWFDLGEPAFVKTIRVFTDSSGWTPHYTESGVEQHYLRPVEAGAC